MFNIDLSKKNAAISLLASFAVSFFVVSILFSMEPRFAALGDKIWGVFMGSWGALFIILNSEAKKDAGLKDDANPSQPDNPAQPK